MKRLIPGRKKSKIAELRALMIQQRNRNYCDTGSVFKRIRYLHDLQRADFYGHVMTKKPENQGECHNFPKINRGYNSVIEFIIIGLSWTERPR